MSAGLGARKIPGMDEQQAARSRWKVTGAKEGTGEAVTLYVEARSAESAERAVVKSGVQVNSVTPEPLPYAQAAGDDVKVVYVDDVSRGAAFTFGFYGFFGAFAAYLLVAAVVAAVLLLLGVITLHGR